jgi:hypothetical protein
VVGAVVLIVSVAVPALAFVIFTGEVVPKLSVGRRTAPAGLDVMVAVNDTLPVKPLLGVMVTVDVLLDVAPGLTETLVPETVKLGGGVMV